jgi:hypothetical protein
MSRFLKAIAVTLLLVAVTVPVWSQGSVGTLNGTILDPENAVVPGAAVILVNVATGEEHKTTSTSAGAYTLPYVPSGTYRLRVSASGFRPSEADNIVLHVAQTLTVNITLEIGQVSDRVTVTDKPQLLEAGTAEMGKYINQEEFKSWPIILDEGQRQIQAFIFSSLPGTTGNNFEGSINGGQEFSHEILIEGIPAGHTDVGGYSTQAPAAEAIGEFKLQTGAVSAQYNGGQTAIANFTIKSGTNDLHGSVFAYLQNEALNAADLSTKTQGLKKPPSRQNNEGFSLGGPVYIPKIYHGRNKTFWFTNYERTHIQNLSFNGFGTLATPAFKNGDFSQLLNADATGNPLSGTSLGKDALGQEVLFGQIYDPKTTRVVNGNIVRDPFPGNIIPASRFDPVSAAVVQKIGIGDPTIDRLFNNVQQLATNAPYFDYHVVGIKMDHNFNEKEHISGFYNQVYKLNSDYVNNQEYLPDPGRPTSGWQQQNNPAHIVRLSLNSVITPTLLNRVAAGYNRYVGSDTAYPGTLNKDLAGQIGLKNTSPTMFPVFTFSGTEYQGGTIDQMGSGYAERRSDGGYVYQDDLTWIHGKHSSRFGYQYALYVTNSNQLSDAGKFDFDPRETALPGYLTQTGNAFASFMLGAVHAATHGVNSLSNAFRQPYHSFYAMDDWKLTPKLTMNIGMRWEVIPPFYEVTGRMSEVDLNAPNPGAGNRPGALVFAKPGQSFNNTYWKQFLPRFGLAYQVNPKLVVRTGYAILSTPPIANNWRETAFTYGFNGIATVHPGANSDGFVDDPSMYLSQPFPNLPGPLPNTDPASANGQFVHTTAKDANRPPYVQNWNFTIQFQLPHDTVLEAAYVGNKGTRLFGGRDSCSLAFNCGNVFSEMDSLPSSLLSMGDILNAPVSQYPQYIPYKGFDTTQTVAQALRPYPQFLAVQEQFPYNTNSNYNSLQVTVTRHFTHDIGFIAAYTWSKAIGYVDQVGVGSYYNVVQDYNNRGLERSVTSFNTPQSLKLTWLYDLPVGKGKRFDLHWANYALGGWKLAAIQNYLSGSALAIVESGLNIPAGIGFGIRPDVISKKETLGGAPSTLDFFNGTSYINPAAFAESPITGNGTPLRVGTAPRFLPNVRGPGRYSENVRISKRFPIYKQKETTFLQIGGSWTNPFNRKTPYISDTTVGDATFGQVFAGGGGKILQLDARIEF